jgi:uncharacterized RmlC-like cupin family protein
MADELTAWLESDAQRALYEVLSHVLLDEAADARAADAGVVRLPSAAQPEWQLSPQGLLRPVGETPELVVPAGLDAYVQLIPPGSRSGCHHHPSEEYLYVLEGEGYDVHRGDQVSEADEAPDSASVRFDWVAGDLIHVPGGTIHQHFNASRDRPVQLVSVSRLVGQRRRGTARPKQLGVAPEFSSAPVVGPAALARHVLWARPRPGPARWS